MDKLVPISRCFDCRYTKTMDCLNHKCGKKEMREIDVSVFHSIPDWCPLESADAATTLRSRIEELESELSKMRKWRCEPVGSRSNEMDDLMKIIDLEADHMRFIGNREE